jgi:hypothetical protein
MKYLFLILSFQLFGQIDYSEIRNELYHSKKVKEVRVYNMNFKYPNGCDSIPYEIKEYNSFGYLKRKLIGKGLKATFKYEYNEENFLFDIDTSGMFVYGYSNVDSLCNPLNESCLTISENG